MPRKNTSEPVAKATNLASEAESKAVNERSLQILLKEYDALRDMYNQAEQQMQSLFNHYLTLLTVVLGGVTLILQPNSGIRAIKTAESLLLMFFAVIGSFYLSSLSTNFAHTQRYAFGINSLRRFILERYQVSLPQVYEKFMAAKHPGKPSRATLCLSFLIPVNTYQLFAATMNSLSWAAAISLIYYGMNGGSQALWRGIAALMVTYLIYSVYSRAIYHFTFSRLNIAIGH